MPKTFLRKRRNKKKTLKNKKTSLKNKFKKPSSSQQEWAFNVNSFDYTMNKH